MASGTATPNYTSTLAASTVDTVVMNGIPPVIKLLNLSGTAAIFYTTDGTTPNGTGGGTERVLGAFSGAEDNIIGSSEAPMTIKLFSTGTPSYAIEAEYAEPDAG